MLGAERVGSRRGCRNPQERRLTETKRVSEKMLELNLERHLRVNGPKRELALSKGSYLCKGPEV